jgi:hypothetical protein
MTATKKTDNHNPQAKLELRRYFLHEYHPGAWGDVDAGVPRVFDCCQGAGTIWRQLKKEYKVEVLGVDLKPQKGRLKIDSVRVLDQPGWMFDVIDVDTYGSPWKHWFAILRHAKNPITVFLTIGIVNIGGISSQADSETLRALGLTSLYARAKSRGLKIPQSLSGLVRDRIGFAACISAAHDFGFEISELIESENPGGHARYIGVRLNKISVPEKLTATAAE